MNRKVNGIINAMIVLGVITISAFCGMLLSPVQSEADGPETVVRYVEVPVEVVVTAEPTSVNVPTNLTVEAEVAQYNPDVSYIDLMEDAIEEAMVSENSKFALAMGDIYETARNMKIEAEGLEDEYPKTNYFSSSDDPEEIYYAMFPDRKPWYTEADLIYASKVVSHESGSDFIPDEHQRLVASVILNRFRNGYWGDTILNVLTAPGQYAGASAIESWGYTERAYENTKYVFDNGPICPENVLYQSNNASNGTGYYKTFYYPQLGTTTYFAYG